MPGEKLKRKEFSILVLVLLCLSACAPVYTINHAAPVSPVVLPDDGAAHYWAQNEWWYYTGHLTSEDHREFGYELTFFKRITNEDKIPDFFIPIPAHWLKDVGMLGHFAITDLQKEKFQAMAIDNFIFNKSKADEQKYDLMIGSWIAREENGKHFLCAEMADYKIELELEPLKPAALHGKNGIVSKGIDHANYYYSFTRMKTSGTLTVEGRSL